MSVVDWFSKRWEFVGDPEILNGGDGTALFAMEYRRANPEASMFEVIDAVGSYRSSVSNYVERWGVPVPSTGVAAVFRRENPGCSFAEVVEAVRLHNERGARDG